MTNSVEDRLEFTVHAATLEEVQRMVKERIVAYDGGDEHAWNAWRWFTSARESVVTQSGTVALYEVTVIAERKF